MFNTSSYASRSRGFAHLLLLAVIAVAVVGIAYGASSSDLAYGAKSALAAVTGAFDTTPRLVITRDVYSPTNSLYPDSQQNVATFDVYPKNVSPSAPGYAAITKFSVVLQLNGAATDVRLGRFRLSYGYYCVSAATNCGEIDLPISATSKNGSTYTITSSGVKLPVYPTGSGRLYVAAEPYYASGYNVYGAPIDSVMAYVTNPIASDNTGVAVPVDTYLAYGNPLPVRRGYGYGYGYYDYTSDNLLNSADSSILTKVGFMSIACPIFKVCDLNGDGKVTTTDILMLYNLYAPPPVITVSLNGATPTASVRTTTTIGAGDTGTFSIPFTVKAASNNVYIGRRTTEMVGPHDYGSIVNFGVLFDRTTTSTLGAAALVSKSLTAATPSSGDTTDAYRVLAGTSRTFTLTVTLSALKTGYSGTRIIGINYSPTSIMGSTYYTINLDSFKTKDVYLVKH